MKRSWIGAALLAVLLIISLAVGWGMSAIHAPVARDLERAAVSDQWEQVKDAALQAESQWNRWHHFRSCFADHTPVEEIDSQFARLRSTISGEDRGETAALAAETAQMVKVIGQAHSLNLWNFF